VGLSKELSSVKRFGPRYGRTNRHAVAKIESVQKGKHQCPYCRKEKAERHSAGIWICKSCGAKFTGRAYTASSSEKLSLLSKQEEKVEAVHDIKENRPKTKKYKDNQIDSEEKEEQSSKKRKAAEESDEDLEDIVEESDVEESENDDSDLTDESEEEFSKEDR
jgi:large subunit ribosomal protein L37Ae